MPASKKSKRAKSTGYYSLTELAQLLEVSLRTLHRWRSRGNFPRPVRFGNSGPRWPVQEIAKWRKNPKTMKK